MLVAALVAGARTASADRPSEVPPPSCLDQSITDELGRTHRRRGVQKREFLKDGHLAVAARGGLFASDLLSSSYMYGGSVALFPTEDLGFEISADLTPVALDLDEPVAEFFGDDRFEEGIGVLGLVNVLWSPVHAKLKIGDDIVHSDVLLSAGAGRLFHHSAQGIAFDAGAALEMFTTSWLTFRLEIRDVVAVQEAIAETRLSNNIIATGGVSLWIPVGL